MPTRRTVLSHMGLATVAAALPVANAYSRMETTILPSQPKKLGWALVGLGKYCTEEIMPNFAHCRHSKIVALVSGHPEKASELAGTYGVSVNNIYNYENFDKIKENKEVDIIYVLTPNALHKDFVIRAAAAGKHVISEKPLGGSVVDAQAMIAACNNAGVQLMTAYRVHFEPFNIAALDKIKKGELGKLVTFTSEHGRPVKPDTDKADSWRVKKALAGAAH